jgi:methionine sulfoxide reductase catalytic subunit
MTYVRDVLEGALSPADDRVHLAPGGPPRAGVVPHLRIGKRWVNTVWLIPLGAVLLIAGIAISRELRSYPAVERSLLTIRAHLPQRPRCTPDFPCGCAGSTS